VITELLLKYVFPLTGFLFFHFLEDCKDMLYFEDNYEVLILTTLNDP